MTIEPVIMPRVTAKSAKPLPLAERKARVAALVKKGILTEKQAKLIDFREPAARERAHAETLVPAARRALARHKKVA